MAASSYTLLGTSLPPLVSSNPSSKTLLVLARIHGRRSLPPLRRSTAPSRFRSVRCSGSGDKSPAAGDNNSSFCIIEGPETVQDFVQMQLQEIQDNIKSRRNKIFLLMEEVRRLRIQQRIKTAECSSDRCEDNEMPDIPSTLPFLPHLTPKTLRQLYLTSFALSFGIILFGGLLAPVINTDEAWNTTIGGGSLGYLVRASVGKCSLAVAAYAAGSSALDIELTAIRSTLHHMYCNHHDDTTKWIIESDYRRTIELIHDKDESPAASFAQLPKEIRFILSGINTYTLIYTLSEFNEPANWLTIFAKNSALELKLGLGGTSYEDFIRNMHLPLQLSQVDPIVASFSGGAVGVISALMLLEANNVQQQEKKRCTYCRGTGYLACARCSARGLFLNIGPISISDGCNDSVLSSTTQRCPNCSGTGKVMCPTCLCTGTAMASEHDPRIDPFDI